MDNVDRLDLPNQLAAFQLTLWFLELTRAFVVLQMRDETYERFKDKPPLDTYRTGVVFHISPPRFVDVVKRRLELSMEYLSMERQEDQYYEIESGLRIRYTHAELESFLKRLYAALFDRRRNISRVLEALAGKDVRRALRNVCGHHYVGSSKHDGDRFPHHRQRRSYPQRACDLKNSNAP